DYNLALFSSSDPNWLTYFFFGGPGNPSANNSLPNLTPYQPTGWSAPIVATKQAGTTADASSITSSDNLFVDWAVQNSGAATITPFFNVQLLIDGSINQTWATTQPLQAGYFISVKDYSIGALSPGNHTLKIVADSTNAVAESNEGDNSYTKTINVLGSSGQSCVPSGAVLCIDGQPGDRRYQIQANFQTAQGGGSSGNGHAIPLSSLGITHGGLFWFFSADNPEITIKVLPTCSFSSHPWVFASALTNVAFTITVTDMKTGVRSTYTNADGHLAGPIQDTGTLPCP
ncbi:MAG: CARDB domain-containing protein, partial [Thermoanaerobaculia bacterium]